MVGSPRTSHDDMPRPQAHRLQKPSWKDGRLAIGIGLIALATIGGALLINAVDDTVEVYAAAGPLVPGQEVTASNVRPVKLLLPGGTGVYLRADKALPKGRIVRDVRAGELVPASAIGSPLQVGYKAVTVEVDATTVATLVRGSVVDVWVSRKREGSAGGYEDPVLMVSRASVTQLPGDSRGFGGSSGSTAAIQVLVPNDRVGRVIGAVNTDARITVVAVADSPQRSGS